MLRQAREHPLTTGGPKPGEPSDERRSVRSSVLMTATVECGGARHSVRVVNLSAHGALIEGSFLPDCEQAVTFHCSGIEVTGWVTWIRPPVVGINFDEPIEPRLNLNAGQTASMVIKDSRKPSTRRPGFRGNQMSDEERAIVAHWSRDHGQRDDS